jgi:general secretion pathway protein J
MRTPINNTLSGRNQEERQINLSRFGGFTLLEVLVAMSLLMVVIALVGTAMRMSIHSVGAGEKKIDTLERFRSSIYIITSQINSEIPMLDEKDGVKGLIFQGKKTSLKIPSSYSIWNGREGFVIVNYEIVEDDRGKKSLKASEVTIGPDNKMETKLFEDLDDLYFEYFSKKKDLTGEGQWFEKWDDFKTMPEQIRMTLIYQGKKYSFIMPLRSQKAVI